MLLAYLEEARIVGGKTILKQSIGRITLFSHLPSWTCRSGQFGYMCLQIYRSEECLTGSRAPLHGLVNSKEIEKGKQHLRTICIVFSLKGTADRYSLPRWPPDTSNPVPYRWVGSYYVCSTRTSSSSSPYVKKSYMYIYTKLFKVYDV